MAYSCEECGAEVLEIDVKCPSCGTPQTSTGAHRMLGNVVLGQYEIIDVLGQGGMSVVYKGRHKLTEQEVALKLLPPELAVLSQVKSRFVEEAKALAQLDHPNIVHLYNFGEENGCFVLAMQYVHGKTFERMILDAEALDWTLACRIGIDVLRALEYAHGRGIIHRDMKPSNVLVREDDGAATVMDFGIAKMTNSTRLTATGQTMGTVRYMSPEQVRGKPVDLTTDLYSLGATLYEAMFGDTPFDGETHFEIMTKHLNETPVALRDLGVDVPIEIDALILKSLAKKPADRFADARQFRKELESVLRAHDPGWSSTMRLTRGNLAVTGDNKASRTSTKPGTGDSGESSRAAARRRAASATPLASPADGPAPSNVETAALGTMSGQSGDDAAVSVDDSARIEGGRPRPATAVGDSGPMPTPRRSFLWVALIGVLLLGGAGATLFALRSKGSDKPKPKVVNPQRQLEVEVPNVLREPLRPPNVSFAQERQYTDKNLRVMAPDGWDLDEIVEAQRLGHKLFEQILIDAKLATEVPEQAMSIAIIPRHVFCQPGLYDQGRQPEDDCATTDVHYSPLERTLFIVNDRKAFDANIAFGNASAVCLHMQMRNCDEKAFELDEKFEKLKKSAKKPAKKSR